MRTHLLALLLTLAGARVMVAQVRPAEIVGAGDLRYPEVLRAAGIGGVVRAEVVVLPGDTVAADGVRVLVRPHRGFEPAVREGLRRWSYRVAMADGVAVADTLVVELTFEAGGSSALSFGPTKVRGLTRDSLGTWHATLSPLLVRGAATDLTGPGRDSAAISAARFLAGTLVDPHGGGARIVCVTLRAERGADPLTADELTALQTPGVAIVHPGRCPPTFASMAYVVGRVIPPGSDPTRIVVRGARLYPGGWIVIRVETPYGSGLTVYDCLLRSDALDRAEACTRTATLVY